MLSLLLCGFMMNQSAVPAALRPLRWLSYFAQAYEALVVVEFHGNPAQFTFTAPVPDFAPIRVTGDGVLAQFGYVPDRAHSDVGALAAFAAACAAATYACLLLGHPDVANAVSAALMGRHPHSRRRRVLCRVLSPVLGDAVLRLQDPDAVPEAETPRTPGSAAALLRSSSSAGSLNELLGLASKPHSPREAGGEHAEAFEAVEASSTAGSTLELMHSRRSSMLPAGAADDTPEPSGHSRSISFEGWAGSAAAADRAHVRQPSAASEPAATGPLRREAVALHKSSLSTASAGAAFADPSQGGGHAQRLRVQSGAAAEPGPGSAARPPVHATSEQHVRPRMTLSWHGLNVSVKTSAGAACLQHVRDRETLELAACLRHFTARTSSSVSANRRCE